MRIIAGEFRGRVLASPKGLLTRPTSSKVRGSFFNSVQSSIEGALFLDLFSGSGAVGLEALSRGAAHAVFVERSLEAQRCIRENIETLGLADRAMLLGGDVFSALKRLKGKAFSMIYIDPPYSKPEEVERGKALMSLRILREIDQLHLLGAEGVLYMEEASCIEMEHTVFESFTYVKRRDFGKTTLFLFMGV